MSNLAIHINLTRIPGVIFTKLTGKSGTPTDCIVIPVDGANLFRGEKGIYLDAIGLEFKEQKFTDTHFIKMSVPKEVFDLMSEEEKNQIPIIGGIKPIEKPQMQAQSSDFAPGAGEGSDLPF
jgi:hypothetical protein